MQIELAARTLFSGFSELELALSDWVEMQRRKHTDSNSDDN